MSPVTWQLTVGESDVLASVSGYLDPLASVCVVSLGNNNYPLYISRGVCLDHHVPGHSTGLTSLLLFHDHLYRTSFQSWKIPLQEP